MPVVRDGRDLPAWSELEAYWIVGIPAGAEQAWDAAHPANRLVIVDGRVTASIADAALELSAGAVVDAPPGRYRLRSRYGARAVLIGGRWGIECGGSGVFTVAEIDDPRDEGDPVDYPKRTGFDRHFHDCDEFWIIVDGRGTAVTEEVHLDIRPGDCVATRMGTHHDLPLAPTLVRGVYIETTLRGQRRQGHLWEHTHGPAIPAGEEATT